MLLICARCVPKLNPIETGEYYTEGEKENKVFKKAKVEIYEITKEEYELANGINVFEDATYRGKEIEHLVFMIRPNWGDYYNKKVYMDSDIFLNSKVGLSSMK